MREFDNADALVKSVGQEVAVSAWVEVEQHAIDQFADATGDHQWIHVDPERAKRESPFGAPVAHGFLTVSLIPALLQQSVNIAQRMGLNYGLNKVRFPAPVPAGSRVRARFTIQAVDQVGDAAQQVPSGGVAQQAPAAAISQVTWVITMECEGSEKPVCIAELITRHYH
ncbi:MaoC family dehydratase [Pseudomonas sp.]|uniref:MaoC family dehydratase n=1 Tax=Pseudomonas sp. TaxID=306 RepID=UPI002612A8DC|nr:MaoC family dehydratase [Pseudomonas sp.]